MLATPADIPSTTPEEGSTDPTAGLLLLHVPPLILFERVMELPVHTVVGPAFAAAGFTVTVVVAEQVPIA